MCLPSLSGSNLEKKNRSNNFRETSEKYPSKMLNLEEEEEKKEKIFEVKEISKEKNKLKSKFLRIIFLLASRLLDRIIEI